MAEIGQVKFGFYSAAALRRAAPLEITEPKTFDATNSPTTNGLFDPRLGPVERGAVCPTCREVERNCHGHLGRIELPVPCYNPLLFQTVHKLLQVACTECRGFRLDRGQVRWHVARMALFDAGAFARADALLMPQRPETAASRKGDPVEAEHRSKLRDAAAAAVAAVERDVADGRLPRNASLHGREKKAEASRELYAACKACRACDRCGAAARKLRRDGAAKLFAQPLSAKAAARDRALGVKKQRAAASPLDDDSDSSDASSEGEPDERELFVTAEEARAQLRLLWKADGAACDGLLGACVCRPGGTDGAEKFFLDVVAVPAPRFRPAQTVGGTLAEHPQNTVLSKALILNRELRKLGSGDDAAADQVKLLDLWLKLQGAINDYVDSSKSTQREAPPGIKQLLEKKEGLFRKHMMGKRVDYCCRSVISPDPFIGGHEIGMPVRFAKALSYPEPVTPHNVEHLRRLVRAGPDAWPGANYVDLKPGGRSRVDLRRVTSAKRRAALAQQLLTTPGQRVGRHVLDGDSVLVNRQPSLHKPSIMAHSVKVLSADSLKSHQTLRMHYANCNAYNADFDGDEINVHFPQSELARAEAQGIAATHEQYVVPTDGKPLRGLIQDHIACAVKLSMPDSFMTRDTYCQMLYEACVGMRVDGRVDPGIAGILPAVLKPVVRYTGRQLLSAVLAHVTRKYAGHARAPTLTSFEGPAKVKAKAIGGFDGMDEATVLVRRGRILRGVLDKASIGASANGLVHAIYELYGGVAASSLLDALCRVLTMYLATVEGHTCGIGDLVLTKEAEKARDALVATAERSGIEAMEAFLIDRGALAAGWSKRLDANERATTRSQALAKVYAEEGEPARAALDAHMMGVMAPQHSAIVKACLPDGLASPFPRNSFALMVTTGAKGSVVNQSQISCALGQQSLEGRRVPLMARGNSLPCFPPHDPSPRAGGFVADRFLTGIRPPEYYFHCMAGREGLVDTAVKTSRSGYLQRCLVKHLEGLKVAYDHTVRDDEGQVIQFLYGDDGLDACKTHFLSGAKELQFLGANHVDADDEAGPDSANRKLARELGAVVTAAREASRKIGLVKGARADARRRAPNGWSRLFSACSIAKVRSDGTRDVVFDADGLLEKRVPLAAAARRRTFDVLKPAGPVATPVNGRFEAWRHGAVSDRVEALLDSADAAGAPPGLRRAVYRKYASSLAAPGEAVGALAAQSVGEPSTQMTLNTFHLAGHGAGNVTLGIPRLREIIMTASDHIKTPQMTLPLVKGADATRATAMAFSLKPVTLQDVADLTAGLKVTEIVRLDKGCLYRVYDCTVRTFPADAVDAHYGLGALPGDPRDLAKTLAVVVRRFVTKLTTAPKLAPVAVPAKTPAKAAEAAAAASSDDDDESDDAADDAEQGTLRFGRRKEVSGYDDDDQDDDDDAGDAPPPISDDDDDDDAGEPLTSPGGKKPKAKRVTPRKELVVSCTGSSADGRLELNVSVSALCSKPRVPLAELVEAALAKVKVREHPGVTNATFVPDRMVDGKPIGAVIVEGGDFASAWAAAADYSDAVDVDGLEANDVAGVLRTYGVEAARRALVREVEGVFGVYGISVEPHHLSLIADYMTCTGGYRAMNRGGMASHSSPWLQMSYETTAQFLAKAAQAGAVDDISSPSARIVVGRPVGVGTNSFDVVVPLG